MRDTTPHTSCIHTTRDPTPPIRDIVRPCYKQLLRPGTYNDIDELPL